MSNNLFDRRVYCTKGRVFSRYFESFRANIGPISYILGLYEINSQQEDDQIISQIFDNLDEEELLSAVFNVRAPVVP